MSRDALLRVEGLEKHFPVTAGVLGTEVGRVRAVDGVSFELARGETLGLVGESGCGKTTLGRAILRLEEPTAGRVTFEGRDLLGLAGSELRRVRRDLQMVFQDPQSSLNPRMTAGDIVGESLRVHRVVRGRAHGERVAAAFERVGLPASWVHRYPHEFSGGQRQRLGIARAIALEPKLIVCDEAVSALDVSIQAQVINLLIELQRSMDLAYLFIAHDLSVVRHVSDRVAVMYLGQIVERAETGRLFENAVHPYTRALLSAVPVPDPRRRQRRQVLEGDVPSPRNPPPACRFHTRCPAVMDRCRREVPPVYDLGEGHRVRCFLGDGTAGARDWRGFVDARAEPAPGPRAEPAPGPRAEPAPAAVGSRASSALPSPVDGRPARGIRVAVAAGIGLALLLALPGLLGLLGRDARARQQYAALWQQLEEATALRGAPPARLEDLGWRLFEVFEDGRAEDPWHRPWRYRVLDAEAGTFALGSDGPDGVAGSGDDVGEPPAAAREPPADAREPPADAR